MGCRGYPAEFRRKVLDLVEAGHSVADVARDLDISTETVYAWRDHGPSARSILHVLLTDTIRLSMPPPTASTGFGVCTLHSPSGEGCSSGTAR